MIEDRTAKLAEFVAWVAAHIRGDEKGEAQVFLERLFRAFGHAGVMDAGATLEERVKKTSGKGTSFADLVWKPHVVIEMKKRGEDLARHYRQAFDYWIRLVPGRPRYAILCNFDEFWIYDFDIQMDAPLDRVKLVDLPTRWGPLGFLFASPSKPVFGNDQVAVTRKAADNLADCFNRMVNTKRLGGAIDRDEAQRFTLQMMVALFAEDIGMLPRYMMTQLLDDCKTKQDSRDLIGGLFEAMNTREKTPDDRYRGVDYFNGGLFAAPARPELKSDEIGLLKAASREDWSKVRPEIFGTLFEHSLGKEQRHAYGAHFTHPADIMKIVGPTIVEPWRKVIEEADTLKRLRTLWQRMQDYTVLDPACGSGNFLYIAYRELKRLEARLFERSAEISEGFDASQRIFGFVSARQFYGMDINPFAVELAKVTMMIARKLAIDELHITERALPLDNLEANFVARDALIDPEGKPTTWPHANVIIGNPPFLGAKRLKPERGTDYVKSLRLAYPKVPGMADYCIYWVRKAHDSLRECSSEEPESGRAGLVGTQNIRNNQSRVGGLDHVVLDGTIIEAVENQPWSGEANVSVSIANWVKTQNPALLPARRRLWFKVGPVPGAAKKAKGKTGGPPASKVFELNYRECDHINSSLSDKIDVSKSRILTCNKKPQRCFQGIVTGYNGFVISKKIRAAMVKDNIRNAAVVKPYLIGRDLVSGNGNPSRSVIDFASMGQFDAREYPEAFTLLEEKILPKVMEKADEAKSTDMADQRSGHLERWWQFWNVRTSMRLALKNKTRYIALSRVTKCKTFCFVSTEIIPDGKIQVFAFQDDYSFGVLLSDAHWRWFFSKCAKLTERLSYSPRSVFHTFPWPQSPTDAQIAAVADAGREIRRVRAELLPKTKGGLRAIYRTLDLPGKNPLGDAHMALDRAVMAAYGFSGTKDLLSQLLDLNRDVAERIESGQSVVSPGIPPSYPNPASLITADCIRP